jgi:hypothetical protein
VLSWVQKCVEDRNADNIVFKYTGALRDFDQHARAARRRAASPVRGERASLLTAQRASGQLSGQIDPTAGL